MSSDSDTMLIPAPTRELATIPSGSAVRVSGGIPEKPYIEYINTFRRYKVTIALCIVAGTIGAMSYFRSHPPLYQSSALVSIGQYIPPTDGPLGTNLKEQSSRVTYPKTQLALIKSFELAHKILSRNQDIADFVHRSIATTDAPGSEDAQLSPPSSTRQFSVPVPDMTAYLRLISYAAVPETNLVRITAVSTDAGTAAKIANVHSQGFIDLVHDQQQNLAETNLEYLKRRKDEARERAQQADQAVLDYATHHRLDFSGVTTNENPLLMKYKQILSNLSTAISSRVTAEANYREYRNSSGMANMRADGKILERYIDYSKLLGRYEAYRQGHLKGRQMKQLEQEITISKHALRQLGQQQVRDARSVYYASLEKERFLRKELENLNRDEMEHSKLQVELQILKQKAASAKEAFKDLESRLEDAMLNAENELKNVLVLDAALPLTSPINAGFLPIILGGILCGALIGMALALIRDAADSSIHSVGDSAHQLGLALIGTVPAYSVKTMNATAQMASNTASLKSETTTRSSRSITSFIRQGLSASNDRAPVLLAAPFGRESEAIRSIVASLSHTALRDRHNVVLFTSPRPQDGKSSVAVNTAVALAQMQKRTLLIDGDLRCPSVHKFFGFHRDTVGLVDFASGDTNINDLILETHLEYLTVLLSGSPAPLPAALLDSEKVHHGIQSLSPMYDAIIIDSPPVGLVADPLLLARSADHVVMVLRYNQTPYSEARSAIDKLRQVGANIIGFVINGVTNDSSSKNVDYYEIVAQQLKTVHAAPKPSRHA